VPTAASQPTEITIAPDGNLWFTEYVGNKIGMINPKTLAITESAKLPGANPSPNGITAGPDGNVWFTEFANDAIRMINPATLAVTTFTIPTANAQPYDITTGPDGNLWFTEQAGNKIGMFNPTTQAFTESTTLPTGGSQPSGITTGPDGNVWFTESGTNKVGVINPKSLTFSEFNAPAANSQPDEITTGPDGDLWFTEHNVTVNKIATINPITHGTADFAIPVASSGPVGIATGPDGKLWFTEPGVGASNIGVLSPATYVSASIEPPAFVAPGSTFGLTVTVNYLSGLVDTGFSGPVTVALVNPGGATLGGNLTVNAKNGLAAFSGLTINQLGANYRLIAYTDPLTATYTTPVTVDVAPTIVAEKILYTGKGRRKHVVGFELDFSKALNPTQAQNVANYAVTQTAKIHGKPGGKAVALASAVYNAATHAVTLTISGNAPFLTGGQIVVNGTSPLGVIDTLGDLLDGTGKGVPGVSATLLIGRRARGITLQT
jgi:streptogramin lyase